MKHYKIEFDQITVDNCDTIVTAEDIDDAIYEFKRSTGVLINDEHADYKIKRVSLIDNVSEIFS